MAIKHLKRFLLLLIIRKIQTKSSVRYYYSPIRIAERQRQRKGKKKDREKRKAKARKGKGKKKNIFF